MSRRNVGGLDRAFRVALGAVFVASGLFLLDGLGGSVPGLVIAAVGLLGLATGAIGFCLVYVPLGISTAGKARRSGISLPA